jgi:hypothetical protein
VTHTGRPGGGLPPGAGCLGIGDTAKNDFSPLPGISRCAGWTCDRSRTGRKENGNQKGSPKKLVQPCLAAKIAEVLRSYTISSIISPPFSPPSPPKSPTIPPPSRTPILSNTLPLPHTQYSLAFPAHYSPICTRMYLSLPASFFAKPLDIPILRVILALSAATAAL